MERSELGWNRLRCEAAAIVVVAAAAAISPPPMTDADTLSRLAVARSIVAHGALPRNDPFTIDAGPPHHSEWLGDLLWLSLFRLDGERGLALGRLLVTCAAMLLTLRLSAALGASPTVAALLLL
ncbi:MAG: hypothetical protein ACOY3Y_01575, partial [Acidobacteriota bacterium]